MIRFRWMGALSICLALPLALACGGDDSAGSGGGAKDGGAGTGGAGASGGAGGASGGAAGASGGAAGGGGVAGGTGGSGGLDCSPFASVTSDTACKSYATEYCKVLGTCAPAYFPLFNVADAADCAVDFELVCKSLLEAPGSGVKPAAMAAIADVFSKLTCSDFYSGTLEKLGDGLTDPSCVVPGTLANGKACYEDAQCQSDHCDVADGALCGACQPAAVSGASCTFNSDCADGFYCDFDDTCAAEKKIGESCAGFLDCVDGAYCGPSDTCVAVGAAGATCAFGDECQLGLVCGSAGTCKTPVLGALGASCDPDEFQSCNSYLGFDCDDATQKCAAESFPGPGEPCGLVQGVYLFTCSGGATCVTASGSNTGTCVAVANAGAACNLTTGPECGFTAECVNGTCQVPSATTCPPN